MNAAYYLINFEKILSKINELYLKGLLLRMLRVVLSFLIISSIFFYSCVKEVSEPIEPAVLKKLKLIPADPINIIYLNIKNIKRTKIGKNFFDNELEFPEQVKKTILDTLGINFNKDVDEMIISTQWDDVNTFILTLNKPVTLKKQNSEFQDLAYYFLEDKILVISNDKESIEKIKAGDFEINFIKHPLFRRIINSLHYKEHFWFVTRNTSVFLKLLKDGSSNDQKVEQLFRAINFINFSLKFDKDLSLNSHWECVDEYRANLLKRVLNGIISIVVLTEPNDPFVKELAKSEFSLVEKGVEFHLKIPSDKIEIIKQSIIANKLKRLAEYER